ncbi:Translation machinery-associated protein 46 [Grifola frondosa]|uniref:Translation machinery-associated protein 46 n=1 Tax=Grifola frondosa TaxID=5627 RepID=A0A1C7LNT2_GRIFR|nr:Translation machinery-associated protein 46 [Grifola frondosa]
MPPKKQQAGSSSKPKEDKTFGMKNKNKSARVQKQIAAIEKQQAQDRKSRAALEKEKEKALREKEKAEMEKRKKEEAALFKPVQTQKIPFGVDPKTVLCAFYKAGHCDKGSKCKFSHDLDVGRKVEKKNLYEDSREDKMTDTMDKWDEEKLRTVVLSKTGNPRTTTDIVCKYFIQAIESEKYGWFWECPNGESCHYRHALPPGFVLKSQKKAAEDAEKANTISLEEFLEVERHKLGSNLTPVTPESFAKWKQTRMNKKQAEEDALRKTKDAQHAAGKNSGMSGRDLFTYNPEWFEDEEEVEEEEWDLAQYRKQKEEEDLAAEAQRIHDLQLEDESEGPAHDAEGGGTSSAGSD